MNAFATLAEPSRRMILSALRAGPTPVGELVAQLSMSQPVVSKHLRILREAGFVSVQPEGQRRLYSLEPGPLREIADWVLSYRSFWDSRLDDLEQHLDGIGSPLDAGMTGVRGDDGSPRG